MNDLVKSFVQEYSRGNFVMANSADDQNCYWCRSAERFIIPLDDVLVSRRLKRRIRSGFFNLTRNQCFEDVIEACSRRTDTWINSTVKLIYTHLHQMNLVHSIETWHDDQLVGGLYGVAIDRVFFGESMFSTISDASKVALVYLVDHLNRAGFQLLDAQVPSLHLQRMGGRSVSENEFHHLLNRYITRSTSQFLVTPFDSSGAAVVQRISQKS